MATNNFLEFDSSKQNIQTDAEYQSESQRLSGVSGIAKSSLHNKLFRQLSVMAAAIGEFIKNNGNDATDESVSALTTAITNTFASKNSAENTFETAGGTGTVITLSTAILTDKFSTTFIASSNNSGLATTINSRPLYKPNTTATPSLIAGKAYTIWYSASSNCFFIKASAEGTVVAGDVLAGKTFSNDDDTGIPGTMPNLTGVRNATGVAKWQDNALAVYPEKGYQKGGAGDGEIKVSVAQLKTAEPSLLSTNVRAGSTIFGTAGDSNVVNTLAGTAVASDIVAGKAAYSKGALITGTYSSETYDFPLSLQQTQPTAVKAGHIWVQSSTLAAQITAVKVMSNYSASETNGTLLLVTGNLGYHNISVTHAKTLTSGGSVTFNVTDNTDSTADWTISSRTTSPTTSIKLRRPMVYSKVGSVTDTETAYMWTGSTWALLSQKGSYVGVYAGSTAYLFNRSADTLSSHSSIASVGSYNYLQTSADGTYVMIGYKVYKRTGDTMTEYFTPTSQSDYGYTTTIRVTSMARDGRLVALHSYSAGGANIYYAAVYKESGSTFTTEYITPTIDANTATFSASYLTCSNGADFIAAGFYRGGELYGYYWFKDSSGYTAASYLTSSAGAIRGLEVSYDDNYLLMNDSTNKRVLRYTLDYANSTAIHSGTTSGFSGTPDYLKSHPGGYVFVSEIGSYVSAVRVSSMQRLTSTLSESRFSFNLTGDRMLTAKDSTYQYRNLAINTTNSTFTADVISSGSLYNNTGRSDTIFIPW